MPNVGPVSIYGIMNEGRLSAVLFLDLKKAFDTIDHDTAVTTLSKLNLSSTIVIWFANYLEGWQQLTRVYNVHSSLLPVKCDVPQGSILGWLI